MGKVQQAAGGSGDVVYLRVWGVPGTHITAVFSGKVRSGEIGGGGSLLLRIPSMGLWKVTAQRGTYSFDQEIAVVHYGVTDAFAVINKPFSDCTPAEIQAVARAGTAPQYWQVGDSHEIVMDDGEVIYVKIADFNHDVTPSDNILPLSLIMENCLSTTQPLNASNTNVGGWTSCQFRNSVLPGIKSRFPTEWQAIMKTAKKKTSAGDKSSVIVTTNDHMWLCSIVEVLGTNSNSYIGEGNIYTLFANSPNDRIARINGSAAQWWTRSPNSGYSTGFDSITAAAASYMAFANVNYGIRIGFCVG